jgi:hypothetical protein
MFQSRFQQAMALLSKGLITRAEHHSHPVLARLWQDDTQPAAGGLEKLMGYLKQNTRTVTSNLICASCPAMVKVQQYLLALLDYGMTTTSIDVHHNTNTTGIVFPAGFIQAPVVRYRRHLYSYPHNPQPLVQLHLKTKPCCQDLPHPESFKE